MRDVMVFLSPLIGLFGVLLAFFLNTSFQALRSAIERHEDTASYRARVVVHMDHVEKRLANIDDTVGALSEFKASTGSIIETVDQRLERIERKLDADAARH